MRSIPRRQPQDSSCGRIFLGSKGKPNVHARESLDGSAPTCCLRFALSVAVVASCTLPLVPPSILCFFAPFSRSSLRQHPYGAALVFAGFSSHVFPLCCFHLRFWIRSILADLRFLFPRSARPKAAYATVAARPWPRAFPRAGALLRYVRPPASNGRPGSFFSRGGSRRRADGVVGLQDTPSRSSGARRRWCGRKGRSSIIAGDGGHA